MDNFYMKQLKNNAEQLYFWLLSAAQAIQKGESATFCTLTAAEYAAKIDQWAAHLDERGDDIDWETIAKDAYNAAKAELNKGE